MVLSFQEAGRLPEEGDNCAVAVRRLEPGTEVHSPWGDWLLPSTLLEGHRFAVVPIRRGESLFSWGLPFGRALKEIVAGEYLCNETMLRTLRNREVTFALPNTPNFEDVYKPYRLDERSFRPGQPLERVEGGTFSGYWRGEDRGAGTRNCIVLLGTSSRTAPFVRRLAELFRTVPQEFPGIDGIVPVAHTEGGGVEEPHNSEMVLRTLAGMIVHPNVAAVLAVDHGPESINNDRLHRYLMDHNYPLQNLPHAFLSLNHAFEEDFSRAAKRVEKWFSVATECKREAVDIRYLKLALQCGGSDAFSGISGNPLAGVVARETVRRGGSANLAETDELIGAEAYLLQNMRDLDTARRFLALIDRFQERARWHGTSGEANPSGGNLYRGLYNIAIKSIGAARKKDPAVCLEHLVEYGERMVHPGFHFMDSPGNDLESVAGQVASGCNLVLFVTGNGSITNFPFVPTIKIMTNTPRFQLLSNEMDVNAGRYLDGEDLEALGREAYSVACRVAGGERTAGERAGHSQVQIWRDWRQTEVRMGKPASDPERLSGLPVPYGKESIVQAVTASSLMGKIGKSGRAGPARQFGLILPTSLCAGQVGRMIAEQLNRERNGGGELSQLGLDRFIALPHTEGCGVSSGSSERLLLRTLAGYAQHPSARSVLFLEHGCEKTHNQEVVRYLKETGMPLEEFGAASIQLDGGLSCVGEKIRSWFLNHADRSDGAASGLPRDWRDVAVGIATAGSPEVSFEEALPHFIEALLDLGATVVLSATDPLAPFLVQKGRMEKRFLQQPTLAYGQPWQRPGLHLMQSATNDWMEQVTGLGASGVEAVFGYTFGLPMPGHPLVPVLQVSSNIHHPDLDMAHKGDEPVALLVRQWLDLLGAVLSGQREPKTWRSGNWDFQVSRGWSGLSL